MSIRPLSKEVEGRVVTFEENTILTCKAPHCPFISELGEDRIFIIGIEATAEEIREVEATGIAGVYPEKKEKAVVISRELWEKAILASGYMRINPVVNTYASSATI